MTPLGSRARGSDAAPFARLARAAAIGALALWAGACVHPAARIGDAPPRGEWETLRPEERRARDEACLVVRAAGDAPDTLTLALADRVVPSRAPRTSNRSELVVFGLMYEPLLRRGCDLRVAPGLSSHWREADADADWTAQLRLRDDARYWDGTLVDPRELVERWTRDTLLRQPPATVLDARTLEVPTVITHPVVLVDRGYAVAGTGAVNGWPRGTGPYRPGDAAAGQAGLLLPREGSGLPAIRLRSADGRDVRDLLDDGADLLVAGDLTTIDYARARPAFTVVDLPWDRTYVFISATARAPATGGQEVRGPAPRDVPVPARVAQPPYWWSGPPGCRIEGRATPPAAQGSRIVYDRADAAGRAIAERLVALAASGGGLGDEFGELRGRGLTAAGLDAAQLAAALDAGSEAGYVVHLELPAHQGCPAVRSPVEALAWLDAGMIVPLLQSRGALIVRTGAANVALDADGRVRILPREGVAP